RHGRRDLARADRPPHPCIAPSNHPSSFATPQLSSTRAESNPNPFPSPFPFCAAAGELGLTSDRPAQRECVHESYPRSILKLSRCSCAFLYPEPSFAYNAGDPNIFFAISAGELVSDLPPP